MAIRVREHFLIEHISIVLNLLLQGKQPSYVPTTDYPEEYSNFIELVNQLITSVFEIRQFILPLSQGILRVEAPKATNHLASPFKELHSQLRTLVWQVQQIAQGDYNQRIDFMGEFSEAFNSMVEFLKEKSRLVNEHISFLEDEAKWLKESEARYFTAVKYSPGGIYIFDPDTKRILEVNEQFLQMTEYTEEDFPQLTVFDLYYDRSISESDLSLIQKKSLHNITSRQYKRKTGDPIDVDIYTCWATHEKRRVIITNIQDVSARNKTHEVLKKYKILLEHARDIMLFVRLDGVIIEANKAAEIAYGYDRAQLQSMTIYDLHPLDEKLAADKQMSEAFFADILLETTHCRKDGSTFPVEVSAQGTIISGEKLIVSVIRDITERKGIEDELRYLATHDALTRVPNRYLLEEAIALSIAKKNVNGALLFIDIDNFKLVNDILGHGVGDQLLVKLVTILKNNLRKRDLLARLGGDEFAILLDGVKLDEATAVAEKLRKAVADAEICLDSYETPLTFCISIGVASLNNKATAGEALSHADYLLYQAKEQGRNRIVCQEDEQNTINKLSETSQIVQKIHDALEKEHFVLYFQPVINTVSGQITHHEGLIRLVESNGSLILPGQFIHIAERFGLMPHIDRRVITLSCEALIKYPCLRLFINLSGISLGDESLLTFIEENIQGKGIDFSRLGFEITETTAVRDIPNAERWIRRLKVMGCLFALDDFGIGFSSFSYLQYLSVDFVKIDGSYVRDIHTNHVHLALVQAMNTVVTALGKETIAEYVENGDILTILKECGVHHVQGYYLGKPESIPKV